MFSRRGLVSLAAVAVWACGVGPAAGDTIESVSKAIRESCGKVKSLSAKTRTESELGGAGYKHKSLSEGRFEMLRKGDKMLTRIESKDTSTTEINGKPEKREGTTLVVMDGEFTWSYIQSNGEKNVFKMKSPPTMEQDPLEQYGKTHTLEVLPDEKVDGADAYVVKATPKASGGPAPVGKIVVSYRKDCGFAVKIVTFDGSDKVMSTTTYSDVKIDPAIGPDRFVFKVPEGVKVTDMTQAPPSGEKPAEAKGGEAKPGDAKGEEPKKDAPKKAEEEPKKSGPKLPKLPKLP